MANPTSASIRRKAQTAAADLRARGQDFEAEDLEALGEQLEAYIDGNEDRVFEIEGERRAARLDRLEEAVSEIKALVERAAPPADTHVG